MDYRFCTLKITDNDGCEYFQTCLLNGKEFRKLISEGAELVNIID